MRKAEYSSGTADRHSGVLRRPTAFESRNPKVPEAVTNWKQCAILGLTPTEIMAFRKSAGSKDTVGGKLREARRDLRKEGWHFPPNPDYQDGDPEGRQHPFLRAVPPAAAAPCDADRYAAELQQSEQVWEAEVSRHLRSNWGMRVPAGKAAGS